MAIELLPAQLTSLGKNRLNVGSKHPTIQLGPRKPDSYPPGSGLDDTDFASRIKGELHP